jgi:hypothetical protein
MSTKGRDCTPKPKQNTRHSKLKEACIVLKKQNFEDLQTESFVDVEGCQGHLQAYVLTILRFYLV